MLLQDNDIVVRKSHGTAVLWLSGEYLYHILGITPVYLRVSARPNYKKSLPPCHRSKDILPASGKSWRYARINGQFYYDYDFIPDRKDTQYRSKLGDKDTLIQQAHEGSLKTKEATQKEQAKEIDSYVTYRINNRDTRIFLFHRINGACKFNHQKARQLAESLTWAKSIKHLIQTDKYREFGIETQAEFYDICASILHRKALEGMKITTGESLRKKMHYFPESADAQYEFLISDRYGNDNARRLGKETIVDTETGEIFSIDIHQAIIMDLWMNPGGSGKGSKKELWEEYQEDIKLLNFDIEPVSYSTFCHYTNSYDIEFKTAKERHGAAYFKRVYQPYISGKKPVYGNSLWCADGSSTIAYKYIDEKGKLRTMRLYVIMISDVATGKIVGWFPSVKGGHEETPKMVREAMLMAIRENGMCEVMEFVSDNHGAFTSKESREFLESVCRHVRSIEPGNSQANYAETQFRLFKKRLYRLSNWLGSSWNAKSIEHEANADYLIKEEFPTYEEVIIQLGEKISEWNNMKTTTGISRSELYSDNIHPELQEISPLIWRRLSGNFSKREITRQRGTIVLERKGLKYKFEIPDYEVLGEFVQEYLGYANLVPALIYWDEECADVYTEDSQYMFSCFKTLEASVTHAEANNESLMAIGKGMARKTRAENTADTFKQEVEIVSSLLYPHAEPHPESYSIACMQGKNVKELTNGAQEAAMDKKLQEKQARQDWEAKREEYMQMRERLYKNPNNN